MAAYYVPVTELAWEAPVQVKILKRELARLPNGEHTNEPTVGWPQPTVASLEHTIFTLT